jgi:hypothetical protein
MVLPTLLAACGEPLARTWPFPLATATPIGTRSSNTTAAIDSAPLALRNGPPAGGSIIQREVFEVLGRLDGDGLAIDSHHNRIIVGSFDGTAKLGDLAPLTSDKTDAIVLKLDPSNKPLWVKSLGGHGMDFAQSVVVDSHDDIFVSGGFDSPTINVGGTTLKDAGIHDIFLTKLSPDGSVLWAKRYGDVQDQLDLHLQSDGADGVIATGWFNGTLELGAGPLHSPFEKAFFAARIGPNGIALWNRAFGHRLDFATTDSAVGRNGEFIVTGASDGVSEFVSGGHPSLKNDLGPALLRLDASGKPLFEKRYGRGADNLSTAVGVDTKGNIRLASTSVAVTTFGGEEHSPPQAKDSLVITSLDPQGSVLWSHDILSSSLLSVHGLSIDAAGNAIFVGEFEENTNRGGSREDGFVFKVSEDGRIDWSLDISERGRSEVTALAIDTDGTILTIGSSTNIVGANPADQLWIASLNP